MIKLLVSVAGADFSHAPGEMVTLDPEFERRLIESGQAEPVEVKSRAKSDKRTNKSAG